MSGSASDELLAGRYRLEGVLGSGGMADVHRAWDTHLHRYVALKLFSLNSDEISCRRFENEVRTLAGLSHPGLIAVYDAGCSGEISFVALQLIEGGTLRDRIGLGPMPVAKVRRLGAALADVLAYVHANEVVHRDVKPSNILLDADDVPYLADFGLAQLTDATRLTKDNELVGTAAYLAPEQVRGAGIGAAADIYALGLVLLECLTGQREYQGSEVEAAVARLHRSPVVPDDLPSDLVRLLTLMTSLTPRRRPTALDCAEVLRGDAEPDEVVTSTLTLPPVPEPAQRRRKLLPLSLATFGLAGVAWLGSSFIQPAGSTPESTQPAAETTQAPSGTATPPPPAPTPQQVVVTHTSTVIVPARKEQAVKPPPAPDPKKHTPKAGGKPGNSGRGNGESDD